MTRTYLLIAALGVSIAACGGQGETTAADQATQAADSEAADAGAVGTGAAAPMVTADGSLPPGEVVPGGAIDVLRREGWRVAGVQTAAPPATGEAKTPG